MNSKKSTVIPLLFASINLLYLIVDNFFVEIPYKNILFVINSIFMVVIYFNQKKQNLLDSDSSDSLMPINVTNDSFQINAQILVDHFSDFLCIKDKDGRWLGASDTYIKLFNLKGIDYIGKTDDQLFHYSNTNVDILKFGSIQDKSAWHLKQPVKETRVVILNRQRQTLEITRIPIFDKYENELKLILTGNFFSLDDKKKSHLELLPKVFEICHLNFMFLDKNFQILEVNIALSLLTGYSINELIGKPLSFIIKGKLNNLQADFFAQNKFFWSGEMICLTKSGRDFSVKLEISEIVKEDNSVIYFSSLLDITQQKQAEKRIIKLSYYDELTGLTNRSMFYERLRKFIASTKADNAHATVFVVDLDRFKIINESLGHDAGNELLRIVATRLEELIGANDIAARLSGDEFAVLMLSDKSYEDTSFEAAKLAGRISQKLCEVINIRNHEAFIGSSIGISIYPEDCRTTEPMLKAEVLLKNADIARNKAKFGGKNKYEFFKADNNLSQEKHLMELNLRKAITKNELKLYYQPQYDIQTRKLCGAEVLVRWLQNNENMIPPDQFIAIAEDTGLIIEIGYWIMRTACFQLRAWHNSGYLLPQVSVNVSAPQFNDPNFLESVKKALNESRLTAEYLELEITESMLIGDARFIDFQLQQLQKMGIKLALDDFGTGYSSLSYLKNFPIDILKMDQSFIRNASLESKDSKLAHAIIEIGHSLGQKVIAEGVESQEQFDFLRRRGCDIIQGYYYSKPLSVDMMTEFLKTGADNFNPKPEKKNPFIS